MRDDAAVSADVQRLIWNVLNDPSTRFALAPRATARGVKDVFSQVLVALATTNPTDVMFALDLIDQVLHRLLDHTGVTPVTKETRH